VTGTINLGAIEAVVRTGDLRVRIGKRGTGQGAGTEVARNQVSVLRLLFTVF